MAAERIERVKNVLLRLAEYAEEINLSHAEQADRTQLRREAATYTSVERRAAVAAMNEDERFRSALFRELHVIDEG